MTQDTLTHQEQLLDFELFQDELEVFEAQLPAIHDPEYRIELADKLGDPKDADKYYGKFDLFIRILDNAESVEDVAKRVDEIFQDINNVYEQNMENIFTQTKSFEKTARALNLLYENAGGEANVWIMPVSEARFANASNPKHYDKMVKHLRERFYKWQMENSPFYLTYIGDIGKKSAMDKMAMIAEETRALAIVDIPEKSTSKSVMEYADKQKFIGIAPHLGHLVIPGTWLYVLGASEVEFSKSENGTIQRYERPMAVPASCAIIGRLLEIMPGEEITGLEDASIIGINGVKVAYDLERIDAREWDKRGLIQIEPNGHIQGSTTANKSNNRDLGKFQKVDVANALLKDLIQFCNNKANSKWGEKEKKDLTREFEGYLNRRVKHQLIRGYEINHIRYDTDEETVDIDILIYFYEIMDEFEICLRGAKGHIDFK